MLQPTFFYPLKARCIDVPPLIYMPDFFEEKEVSKGTMAKRQFAQLGHNVTGSTSL